MDKKQFVIGIDIGTTTSKGCIVDAAGNIVAQSSVEHGVERPFDGWAGMTLKSGGRISRSL